MLPGGVAASAEKKTIDFIELKGTIDPASSRYLLRHINESSQGRSHFIVVQLNTPGGLDISMRDIVERMLSSEVPIVVWVSPSGARAASAGVFITYAAHVAVMAPGTSIGAAHPVNLGGELDEVTSAKVTNDAAAYIRSIARQRGRNPDWAEKAVRESAALDAEEAARQNVVNFVAGSPRTLLEELDGRTVDVDGRQVRLSTQAVTLRFFKMGLLESILHAVVDPQIAYFLLLLGFLGLTFEIYNPGIGLAGVLGGVALILAFYALSILPTSWAGVALLLLAVGFFLADLHTGGLGIFTVGGVTALIAGSVLLFSGADEALRLPWGAVAAAVVGMLLFFISAMTAAIRARLSKPVSGAEGMIGTEGLARTDIAPDGQVMARGTLWRARTVGAAIPKGSKVKVRSVSGLMLMVEPLEQSG